MGTQHFRNKSCRAAQKQPFNSRLLLLRSLQRQSAVSPNSPLRALRDQGSSADGATLAATTTVQLATSYHRNRLKLKR